MAVSTLLWFRKGLRLHDNPALAAAIAGSCQLYPIFCLDPQLVASGKMGANRLHFLLDSLADLDSSLRAVNSRLIVLRGSPEVELPRVMREWRVQRLAYEIDTEPYAKARDAKIDALADAAGVEVVRRWGQTLCDLDTLLRRHPAGKPTTTYNSFLNHLHEQMRAEPIVLIDAPKTLPPLGDVKPSPSIDLPTAKELGLSTRSPAVIVRGGESEALARMDSHVSRAEWIAAFEKPSTSPMDLEPFGPNTRSTTVLSPYLAFGCLSPRLLYQRIADVYASSPKHSKPPTSLHGQLYWREFYYCCAHGTPNYERMENNPICRQIPWGENAELLAAWREARTGYPWIDAVMTQLREEGWIHHLARHSVACFLTRGDLWQSWEAGAAVFEELLLDADPALNYGNWMWLSCSCFFYQYFRCYSPVAFPNKYDKTGAYVRKWLPQLANIPNKYIYEPWLMPIADQKKAGCIIGVDYPKPIVEHTVVSKANMGKMAEAYAAHKAAAGASPSGQQGGGAVGKKRGMSQTVLPNPVSKSQPLKRGKA